ncbi:ABC transporter ATP-binding protein [Caldimonas thermodepolymerans]|jgi:peptide/nickel transport system ATP-binding protein|uniref:ABC transporter ATP-binding protein n=1 Tax=Caldimonas thermodepolymerans TaxID=215580 RepID=A0A2S5T410_9BURK|nr:dipeptide ABC transporter ATP-binding protein [Caldimonas thermodepolymerans]PPE69721.1 ABC transporter ATP-binding protein [Caldimonas thermodepolymerans]QPC31867.1 ABC transporter ATP-binding protein [Caldimonas thermodepolymerans]RDI01620.1 peptide/nickel transport system ATP-binding protein [Caldimonas thermodepolymerans]TCP04932.1 peptide/nickel transport system ATP-binding protein [Caldimonas thermodepolymerans]UZG44654.1 dipeptide ABC transporter ATP-binding protein [Caldimonas therm
MLLEIDDLHVSFRMERGALVHAVRGVSLQVPADRTVALVGESGSGKSVTAMSILNLLPDNAQRRGRVLFEGRDLLQAAPRELRALRGRAIACVFQEPMTSLNPVFPVGRQIAEPLVRHLGLSRREALARAEHLLEEVGLPEPRRRLHAYPHELSGGQQQRVMIAMALACEPRLLIADEPTTALDVTVQRQILELLARLKERHRMSMLFISHDLGVVGEIADEVVVMRHGQVRERGPVQRIFAAPQDAYTQALLACRPSIEAPPARLAVVDDHVARRVHETRARPKDPHAPVVLEVQALCKGFRFRQGLWGRREFQAVQGVSFRLRRGHTLGVVGESGSGKTTMGLALLRLHGPASGPVSGSARLHGPDGAVDLLQLGEAQWLPMRRRVQIVFQNPYASLNPRFTVGQTLVEPMQIHRIGATRAEREARARRLLEKVGLDAAAMHKYPHEFSGGQRQRIAIARCLALEPEVLVLDEAVSALDVSVQAQVLNLLKDLQDELGLAYVFISHDLAVVRFMADEVLVMKDGRVVEQGPVEAVLSAPREDYTRRLLAAIPGRAGRRGSARAD